MPPRKLKCVVVDDDKLSAEILKDNCHDSDYIESVAVFNCPKIFLAEEPKLDFDLCLLDINMPGIDGFTVARRLKNKHIILVSGQYDKLKDALDMIEPIDVIPKPVKKERFNKALEKAYRYSASESPCKDYELFYASDCKGKLNIWLDDIIYVKADVSDHRNKQVFLRTGEKYTIMNCTFTKLLELCPRLMQVNKSELISLHILHSIDYDTVMLKGLPHKSIPSNVILSRTFKRSFIDSVLEK